MYNKKIVISNKEGKEKTFNITLKKLEEILNFIKYNGGLLENGIYYFPTPVSYQNVELYLSYFSTPEPLVKRYAFY